MPAPMTLGQAADLIDKSIQKIHLKYTNLEEENYKKYYHVEQTEDYYEKDSSLSALGEASRITESAVIATETPVQGYDKTYTQVFMGKIASFTMYDWKFGIKKRKLEAVVRDLDRSCVRKRERLLTLYLESSINDNSTMTITDDTGNYSKSVVGGDGQEFVDSAHTREDGGATWTNIVQDGTTVNMDFEYDALKAAHRTASLIRDPKGNLMDINLDTLVMRKNSAIYFRAMEILGAIKKNEIAGSADNDGAGPSAFSTLGLPYITSTNQAYWWAFDSSMKGPEYGLQYRESQGVTFEGPEKEFKTGTIYYKSTMAYDFGHNDARGWVGSEGTNAA